jgi:hypothetical protein
MAPEQGRGEMVDGRCDLFSLGVVLYRMSTGELPFKGGDALSILLAVAMENPRPVGELRPDLPPALGELTMQLLAKKPTERPASAREIADRLEQIEQQLSAGSARSGSRTEALPAAPRREPRPAARPFVWRNWVVAALVALAVLLPLGYFYGGTVVRFVTNQGQVVIEVDDPSLEVTVKENGAVIRDPRGKRTITLTAGEHDLEVSVKDTEGEFRSLTKKFTLLRGGKEIVRIRREVLGEPVVAGDRKAAEWVLSIGGTVGIRSNGKEQEITAAKDLPAGACQLVRALLSGPQVTDAGLEHLERLTNLTRLDLYGGQVTDAGLAHLKELTNLAHLCLYKTQVTDAGLAHLKGLTNLRSLGLDGAQVTGTGLADLKGLTNLGYLDLNRTQVTDAGLAHLKGLTNLIHLCLAGARVTDAGLADLKGLTNLEYLELSNTQVRDAGLAHLKGLTKLTILNLNSTRVTDAGVEHLKGLTSLTQLDLNGAPVTDAGLAHLKGLTNLAHLYLYKTQVTDAGLAHLKGLTNLTQLDLNGTQVTDAGLAHLKGLTNLANLDLTGTKVTAEGIAGLKKALPMCRVEKPVVAGDERKAAEWVLSIGGQVAIRRDGKVQEIAAAKDLPAGAS